MMTPAVHPLSDDPEITFRVSHAVTISNTAVKVDLMWKVGVVVGGAVSTLLAAILTVLLTRL